MLDRFSTSRPWWIAFMAWFAVLCWASSRPPQDLNLPNLPHLDKLTHLLYFATGASFLGLALLHSRAGIISPLVCTVVVVLALSGIGIFDEWHQTHTPGRQGGDAYDWIADILGALLGALLALRLSPKLRPPPAPQSPSNHRPPS